MHFISACIFKFEKNAHELFLNPINLMFPRKPDSYQFNAEMMDFVPLVKRNLGYTALRYFCLVLNFFLHCGKENAPLIQLISQKGPKVLDVRNMNSLDPYCIIFFDFFSLRIQSIFNRNFFYSYLTSYWNILEQFYTHHVYDIELFIKQTSH